MLLSPVIRRLILDRNLFRLHNLAVRFPRQFTLVLSFVVAIILPPAGDRNSIAVISVLRLVMGTVASASAAVRQIVASSRGLDVADEDSQDWNAGGDDGHAGFGVAPDEEIDTRTGVGGSHGGDLGGLDDGGDSGEDATAHGHGDTDLFLHLHLEAPDESPGEEGESNVHSSRVS